MAAKVFLRVLPTVEKEKQRDRRSQIEECELKHEWLRAAQWSEMGLKGWVGGGETRKSGNNVIHLRPGNFRAVFRHY